MKESWNDVVTYEQALILTKKFLCGKIDHTPFHYGPPDSETKTICHILCRMNDYGFWTTDSQPGQISSGSVKGNRSQIFIEEQRAYVSGFLLNSWIAHLQENWNKWFHKDMMAVISTYNEKTFVINEPENFSGHLCLTSYRCHYPYEEEDYSHINVDIMKRAFSTDTMLIPNNELSKWMIKNTSFISFIDRRKCRPYLLNNDILTFLEHAYKTLNGLKT